jgi:hemoglobin-like flavoprotein
MAMIATAVDSLDRLDAIVPAVQQLGRRHADYGVRSEHYTTVAEALLWTLEQGLGAAWTTPLKDAWTACYLLLAGVMQEAASQSSAAAD